MAGQTFPDLALSNCPPGRTSLPFPESGDVNLDLRVEALLAQNNSLCDLLHKLSAKQDGEARDSHRTTELLEAIHTQIAAETTTAQFIWNAILQTVLVCIAFLFGIFGIFSWHMQYQANGIAMRANQIALIQFCLTNNTLTPDPCAIILGQAANLISFFATRSFEPKAISDAQNWSWPSSLTRDPTVVIIYYAVPLLTALLGGVASWKIYMERAKSMDMRRS